MVDFPRAETVALTGHEKPLRFQITDFFVPEADKSYKILQRDPAKKEEIDYNKDPDEYRILLYGCTMEGHTVCAEITNYHPYFYLRIPSQFAKLEPSRLKQWVNDFKMYLLESSYMEKRYNYQRQIISKRYKPHLVAVRLEKRKEFMGFTNGEEFHFLKVVCKSLALFNSLKYFFQSPPEEFLKAYKTPFRLYESNIDPMLRFVHDRKILPCGWIEIPEKSYSLISNGCEDDSYCRTNFTVEVDYRYLKPLDYNTTAPLLIVSFDIECTSSHGDFPVAIKDYTKLAKDLILIAQTIRYTKEDLVEWIVRAYKEDVVVGEGCRIHRLYSKDSVSEKEVRLKLEKIIDRIIRLMDEVRSNMEDNSEDEEDENPVAKKKNAYYEVAIKNELTGDLTKKRYNLPQLQGDAIIQIGTTVHRYGSDNIIYKNIITLKSCDPIEGVDVEAYKTEAEVLCAWKELIRRLDPDILMGYNIFGFDMPYVWERAMELNLDSFGVGLGRLTNRECVLYEQRLSSAALGDNVLKYFDMDGVVMVDMYKVMQRTPLDSYKLDFVAKLYLGDQKNDLKPMEIFEKFKGTSADRKTIAEYCVQDCALVNRLFHKLKVLENNNAMGNVCLVPLSYLFMRGQGVKIFSLVAQFCRNENFAIPVLKNFREDVEEDEEEGYEGAIVLPPKEGMYLDEAITVLDYASLYPSSMIERNLSHDCYVNDPAYDNLPNVEYLTVSYDIYEGVGDKKTKVGEKKCKFVQLPNKEKGVIPRILMKLLTQRKNTRKKMEYETVECTNGMKYTGLVKEVVVKGVDSLDITDVEKPMTWVVPVSEVVHREETYNQFEKAVFDALQLAYKVTANSLYGQIGSRVSPIYLKDIAACTTATGRERILMAKNFVEKEYNAEVIYGDSVTADTPILVRDKDGIIDVKTIETISNHWIEYENFRPWDADRTDKEQSAFEGEVWANGRWARVIRVIRHKVNKKLYRINTFQGCVDVTEDHSLVGKNGLKIKPEECVIGKTEICHNFPEDFKSVPAILPRYKFESKNTPILAENETFTCTKCLQELSGDMFYYSKTRTKRADLPMRSSHCKLCIKKKACERKGIEFTNEMNNKVVYYDIPSRTLTKEEAWVFGIFVGDGSCGSYSCKSGDKYSWAINNQSIPYLTRAMEYLHMVEPSEVVQFKILDTLDSSGVYKLVASGSIAYMVRKYRELFYDKDKYKKIPSFILNGTREIREWFLDGYLTADGAKAPMAKGRADFACKGKIGAMGLFCLLQSLGKQKLRVNLCNTRDNIYAIRESLDMKYFEKNKDLVMKIKELPPLPEGEYVYDLETEEGKFNAGVGKITVLNTDSLFIAFPFHDTTNGKPIKGKETLALGIAAGQKASKEIKKIMPEPQCLEYEKTFFPFIIFSKKRYVGLLYEDDANKKPKQKSMGIVLKRRDNAPIVKRIYGGIIDILLQKYSIPESVAFLEGELQKLVEGKYPLEELIITKTLKGNYKDRSKIAHCVLADRIGERDPGNKPQMNDRIPYIYIQTAEDVKLQGDRIESPDYIREKNLTPDYQFYITNQLMKPICQIYALCVEKLPNYAYPPGYWEQWNEELMGNPIYKDSEVKRKRRIDALREQEVESLLFSRFLEKKRKTKTLTPAGAKKKKQQVPTHVLTEEAFLLTITMVEKKANKDTKEKACFVGTARLSQKGEQKFEKEQSIPKSKLRKADAYNRFMYGVLKTIVEKHEAELVAHGIQLQVDKAYMKVLKTTMEEHEEIMENLRKAEKEGDMISYEKYNDMISTLMVAQALSNMKFCLVEPPAKKTMELQLEEAEAEA